MLLSFIFSVSGAILYCCTFIYHVILDFHWVKAIATFQSYCIDPITKCISSFHIYKVKFILVIIFILLVFYFYHIYYSYYFFNCFTLYFIL